MSNNCYQRARKLYMIRNVSGRATRKAVMEVKPLVFGLVTSDPDTILTEFRAEDTSLPYEKRRHQQN